MLAIAKKYGGLAGGPENGIKGYQLTYMIAYIRDFCLLNSVVAESFETSCPWSEVGPLCKNVKQGIYDAGKKFGMGEGDMFASFRVTQLYETGAAVYVYFSVNYKNLDMDIVCDIYEAIEHETREIVMKHGGSVSHHHGVGKLRKRFMEKSFTNMDMYSNIYTGIKKTLDPENIFGANNTIYRSSEERTGDLEHEVKIKK